MAGIFVAIVGPSGAGKDSVMSYARARISPDIVFVRRVITRPADAGSEDHDSLPLDAFQSAEASGAFAVSWGAHGLHYGLPVALETDLDAGKVVVANLSRAAIPRLRARYGDVVVVEITARPDVIAARLAGRGRESGEAIAQRMSRKPAALPPDTITIDNSGSLETAGEQLLHLLLDLVRQAQPA